MLAGVHGAHGVIKVLSRFEVLTVLTHYSPPSVYYTCQYACYALSKFKYFFALKWDTYTRLLLKEMTAKYPQIGKLMGCLANWALGRRKQFSVSHMNVLTCTPQFELPITPPAKCVLLCLIWASGLRYSQSNLVSPPSAGPFQVHEGCRCRRYEPILQEYGGRTSSGVF